MYMMLLNIVTALLQKKKADSQGWRNGIMEVYSDIKPLTRRSSSIVFIDISYRTLSKNITKPDFPLPVC